VELKDKVALVTGSSTGIGKATALALAQEGADTIITYIQNREKAEQVAKAIRALGRRAMCYRADVTKAAQVDRLVKAAIRCFGRIDILVNNVGGVVRRSSIVAISERVWDLTMSLNLKSTFLCCRAVIPHMIKQKWGRIINMSSIAARLGGAGGLYPYAVAKAGVIALMKGLARELAPAGITMNAIAPGAIDTPFYSRLTPLFDLREILPNVPVGRVGTAEEVARVIVFLASDEASYIIGQTIDVNGGWILP
jgi:3-oxoacyl-[acyl-carrier protein] reductase